MKTQKTKQNIKHNLIWILVSLVFLGLVSMSLVAQGTWIEKADMPTARFGASTSVVDGKIYAIGGAMKPGASADEHFAQVEVYDPLTDTWTAKAEMPTAKAAYAVGVVDGKIYVIGGSRIVRTSFQQWKNMTQQQTHGHRRLICQPQEVIYPPVWLMEKSML